jgi:hypothetical protein
MRSLPPGDDHPGLLGEEDGLHPVAQAELGQQVADVGLDGRIADEQGGGDLICANQQTWAGFGPEDRARAIANQDAFNATTPAPGNCSAPSAWPTPRPRRWCEYAAAQRP